jgi:hypothetical protein
LISGSGWIFSCSSPFCSKIQRKAGGLRRTVGLGMAYPWRDATSF